jgi:hypothetical protein
MTMMERFFPVRHLVKIAMGTRPAMTVRERTPALTPVGQGLCPGLTWGPSMTLKGRRSKGKRNGGWY